MFIEFPEIENNSLCPLCGARLSNLNLSRAYNINKNTTQRLYSIVCPNKHLVFVSLTTSLSPYAYYRTYYLAQQDIEDHYQERYCDVY